MKIGIGYDIHRLVKGRKLILGGVHIPFLQGLKGWSDGDVLLHSVCDALLGALGEGDIGEHFPPDNLQYKDISSLILLEKVCFILQDKKYKVHNVDTVIVAEEPKLAPYREKMCANIALILKIKPTGVNVKNTTNEGLGSLGKGAGIAAYAVVSIEEYS